MRGRECGEMDILIRNESVKKKGDWPLQEEFKIASQAFLG
jgi:hypothetical protein